MHNKVLASAKFLWIAACLAVLLFSLCAGGSEVSIFFGISMMILTAPLGVAVMLAWGAADLTLLRISGAGIPGDIVFTVVLWMLLVAAGYVQWFKVLPWIGAAATADRPRESKAPDRRESNSSTRDMGGGLRWWPWIPSMILVGGACWAVNLALGNWWAAGGPPVAPPELYEQRGNLSCAVAVVFILLAVFLLSINLRRLRRSTGPGK